MFKVGDVVVSKANPSLKMTVASVVALSNAEEQQQVKTHWFSPDAELKTSYFNSAELKAASE